MVGVGEDPLDLVLVVGDEQLDAAVSEPVAGRGTLEDGDDVQRGTGAGGLDDDVPVRGDGLAPLLS